MFKQALGGPGEPDPVTAIVVFSLLFVLVVIFSIAVVRRAGLRWTVSWLTHRTRKNPDDKSSDG